MNRFENMHPGLDIDHIDNADQRLWHRLERVQMLSGRLLRVEGGRLSRGRDASRGQGRVLKALALVPEISQKDLMVLLDMRQQSLAELLAKLEAKGLVEREQDAEDRRRQVVRLTEAGRAEAAEVGQTEEDRAPLAPFNCLTDEEKANLEEYLKRVADGLEETLRERLDATEGGSSRRHGSRRGRPDEGGFGHCGGPDGADRRHGVCRGRGGRGQGGEGAEDREGRGHRGRRGAGSAEGSGPRFKRRNEQFPALAGEPAGADDAPVSCDHNCRSCPLRGTASCIKRH